MNNFQFKPAKDMSVEELKKELELMLPSAIIRAQVNAINRTTRGMRSLVSRHVRETLAIKARGIKATMDIKKAPRGKPNAKGELTVKHQGIPLKYFSHTIDKKAGGGIRYRVRKKGKRKLRKGGFKVAQLNSHLFVRKTKSRLPIAKLWGPSIVSELESSADQVEPQFLELLNKNLESRIRFEVEKYYNKR